MRRHAKASVARSTTRLGSRKLLVALAAAVALTLVLGVTLAAATAPTVTIENATEVSYQTAKAEGTVDPQGQPTTYRFQYATQADFSDATTAEEEVTEAAGPVIAEITGLAPNTTYHLRLVAENGETSEVEAASTFTTKVVAKPIVSVPTTPNVAFTTAKASGTVEVTNTDPAFTASCVLQYVTDAQWGEPVGSGGEFEAASQIPCTPETAAGSSPQPVEVTANLTELAPATKYHLRFVASNAGGSTAGSATTFTTESVAKPLVTIEAPSAVTATSAHFSGHVDPNGADPAFDSTWSFECIAPGPACSGLTGGKVLASEGEQPVATDAGGVQGLQPNTTYTVKLSASNLGGSTEATEIAGQPVSFKTPAVAPEVATGTNSPDNQGGVIVRGYVNPRNSEVTSCSFEYSLDTSFSQSAPCQGAIGSGSTPQTVTVDLAGLDAGATYNFRIVAASAAGPETSGAGVFAVSAEEAPEACPNQVRREEQHSSFLPDCRAYEMVSPADKNGADVIANSQRTRAAADGSAAMFASLGAFADTRGTGVSAEYLSERSQIPDPGSSGWATHAITPAQDSLTFLANGNSGEAAYQAEVSADLTKGVVRTFSPLTDNPNVALTQNIYLRDDLRSPGAGHYQLLNDCLSPPDGPCSAPLPAPLPSFVTLLPGFRPWVAGASADFSHVLFETSLTLTNDAPLGFGPKLYEYHDGVVRLAGILPDSACGSPPCAATTSVAGQGAAPEPNARYTPHTISADGSRIFLTANPTGCTPYICGELYMRSNNGSPSATSVQLNASERTTCADHDPCDGAPEPDPTHYTATYWDASTDGSRVFFTTQEALTDDAPVDTNNKLYMYDAGLPASDPHNLTLLNVDHDQSDGADAYGVIGASDDGHYVYFVNSGQLVAGGPTLDSNPPGVFLWHDGHVHFVGRLGGGGDATENVSNEGSVFTFVKQARVSTDGRALLFSSSSGAGLLTPPYQQAGHKELYVYRADTEQLSCASCNPDSAPATSDATTSSRARSGGSSTTTHLSHALSDDGRFAFFTTAQALVPSDTNDASDAYVFDTETDRARLLSSGTSPDDSYFMDASADGSDAFFLTRQRLLGWDGDGAYDLYDTRVGGGFPEPPPQPAACLGAEACHGATPAAPPPSRPATPGFQGPGNPRPKPCPKGKVRKGGKCVKKPAKSSHHKKHKQAGHNIGGGK